MTYTEILEIVKLGKVATLPHFVGYFKWNFGLNKLEFFNDGYRCDADKLPIHSRTDWRYII